MIDFAEWSDPLREMRDRLVAERDTLQLEIDHIDQVLAAVETPPTSALTAVAPNTAPSAADSPAADPATSRQKTTRGKPAGKSKATKAKDNTLVMCPDCEKWVKPAGLAIHRGKAHPTPTPAAEPAPAADHLAPAADPVDDPASEPDAGPYDLNDVAEAYRDALACGVGPVTALATRYGCSRMVAEHLISQARTAGLDLSLPALADAHQLLAV